ncbi:MAG: imidazole glycerol phosphate synthase subunit HisH [Ignavibacteria bacterium]|nr:imidazole glycerol phosphate synthase subunit HisH [Ignavibacteria bacterium]
MITIVNYGLGNLGSIYNMLRRIGVKSVITSDPDNIKTAEKIILPGVGHFDKGMNELHKSGLREVLNEKVLKDKVPVLGICLGMQLMTNSSEEGTIPGLGWIDAATKKFLFENREYKIPHMGWNVVSVSNENKLIRKDTEEQRFYFVHSYFVEVSRPELSFLRTNYGIGFDSGIFKENIYGIQFHPEKSHKFGMNLLKKFSEL